MYQWTWVKAGVWRTLPLEFYDGNNPLSNNIVVVYSELGNDEIWVHFPKFWS